MIEKLKIWWAIRCYWQSVYSDMSEWPIAPRLEQERRLRLYNLIGQEAYDAFCQRNGFKLSAEGFR